MRQKLLHSLGPVIGVVLFAAALWVLHHELQQYHYHEVMRHIEELSATRLLLALALTMLSYLVLTGYDLLSFRYIHHPLAYQKIALASFIGYAFSHTIGFAVLTGGSIRYRFYSTWGLSTSEITNVVAFNGVTFWFGFLTLGGLAFLLEPLALPASFHLPVTSLRPLGAVFLLIVAAYIGASIYRPVPFTIRDWKFHFPTPALATTQAVLSSLDWALAGSVLYTLLPLGQPLSYPHFLGIYLLAQLALLGDKELLFHDSGNAVIMYGVQGRSWVAPGDPVGPEREMEELAWRFRELSDRHGGWTVFYEISKAYLPLYLDLGLSLLKLGEHARVPLMTFSLEGKSRKPLRNVCNRFDKDGCQFVVVPTPEVVALVPELKVISDAWLAEKKHPRERFLTRIFRPTLLTTGTGRGSAKSRAHSCFCQPLAGCRQRRTFA
jgi:uncharacterized membrane protein YbhN (UPF0104 family)